jgi:hypothetical protein
MIRLRKALQAWRTPAFRAVLKEEIEQLDGNLLPLQQGLAYSSHANVDQFTATLLGVVEETDCLRVTAGLFYTGIIAGCSCADDPTPVDEINEYCEARFDIDKATAETVVTLLSE